MSHPKGEYDAARQVLRGKIVGLIAAAEAAEADSWGADVFRRLLSYARVTRLDLEADLFDGGATKEALGRLQSLGAELSLHQWVEVWPEASTYNAIVADTLASLVAFRDMVRARSAGATGT
jgi:hypothetical protein